MEWLNECSQNTSNRTFKFEREGQTDRNSDNQTDRESSSAVMARIQWEINTPYTLAAGDNGTNETQGADTVTARETGCTHHTKHQCTRTTVQVQQVHEPAVDRRRLCTQWPKQLYRTRWRLLGCLQYLLCTTTGACMNKNWRDLYFSPQVTIPSVINLNVFITLENYTAASRLHLPQSNPQPQTKQFSKTGQTNLSKTGGRQNTVL